MEGARFFFGFNFFADALFKKKYRENIARTLRVTGGQYRHCDKNSIYCAALAVGVMGELALNEIPYMEETEDTAFGL